MKVFFSRSLLALWLWLSPDVLAAEATDLLLIVTRTPADEAAAARLSELSARPSEIVRAPEPEQGAFIPGALDRRGATMAVLIDSARGRVTLVGRDGSERTRVIAGEPTPYLVAFVASELLALGPTRAEPPPPPLPAPPASRRVSHVARFDGQLALDVARPYTTAWVVRPRLGLGLWLKPRSDARVFALVGASVAGPARVQRSAGGEGHVSVVRWDTALRAGVVFPFSRVRFTTYARGVAAFQRAAYSGAFGARERATSLGLGVGAALEVAVTPRFALNAGLDLDALLRRALFTLHDARALREPLLFLSAGLGLTVTTAWP